MKKIRIEDLKPGMFVSSAEDRDGFAVSHCTDMMIDSAKEISFLTGRHVKYVVIDPSRSGGGGETERRQSSRYLEKDQAFELYIHDLDLGGDSPVDLYRDGGDALLLILSRGSVFTGASVIDLMQTGITKVYAPLSQRDYFARKPKEQKPQIREDVMLDGETPDHVSEEKIAEHVQFIASYHPINPMVLEPGMKLPFELFLKENGVPARCLGKGDTVSDNVYFTIVSADKNALILKADVSAYQDYIRIKTKKCDNERVRAAFVRENSKIIVEDLASNPRSEKLMGEAKSSVEDIIHFVIDNPNVFYNLTKINNYDYYTFTHSVNVATFSVALAIMAGMKDRDELTCLGLGSMLHDLGKSKVALSIVNKPGRLSEPEFEKIKSHVELGYDIVKHMDIDSELTLMPLMQHHERVSGRGYPFGLVENEISFFGRVVGLVDVYDALTTKRSYKKAMHPYEALLTISKSLADYDTELFSLLVSLIHKQEI